MGSGAAAETGFAFALQIPEIAYKPISAAAPKYMTPASILCCAVAL
jgi:nucleoside 2-deoxyribosyltransferase